MSTESKKYRSEMRAKANRLGNSKSPEKVDASSWTPGKPLNADKKTGARPLRARIYKAGGRVQGDRAPTNAGKEPRANGGPVFTKTAKGGEYARKELPSIGDNKERAKSALARLANRKDDKPEKANGGALSVHNTVDENKEKKGSFHDGGFKKGGKAEKACGGGRMAKGGAVEKEAPKVGKAVSGMLKKADIPADTKVKIGPYKADEKQDKKEIKTAIHKHDKQQHGGKMTKGLKKGGEADSMGGRVERAKGGRTKGKTNINIIIGSGAGGGQQAPNMPPPGAPVRPPPPPQNAPPPPMMGGPPPGPPPGGPPPGPPPGGPPGMPPGVPPGMQAGMRAAGGRVAGYRSKDAGAGSGLGRLRKVHKEGQHTPGFKGA